MRSSKRVGWGVVCAVVALIAAPPAWAQTDTQKAKEMAQEAADVAIAEETGAEPASAGPNPLAVDPDLALWTLVVFGLLFWFLSKFAWPQIAAAIDERERKIAAEIAAAKEMNEEARRLLAEHDAKLAAAAGEVRALLEEARRDAEHTRKKGEERGQEEAKAIVDRAILEIERAKDGALHELAVKVANTATELAKEVITSQLTPEQNNKLVREALGKLAASAPSTN